MRYRRKGGVETLKLGVMAKQMSALKFTGSVGDLNFYQTRYGYFVRQKSTLDAERYRRDPAFKRARENNTEFGKVSGGAAALRRAFYGLWTDMQYYKLCPRTVSQLHQVMKMDNTGKRGERLLSTAFQHAHARQFMKGFQFNSQTGVRDLLAKQYDVNMAEGSITINDLVPNRDIKAPKGATHVVFQCWVASVDFNSGNHVTKEAVPVILPLNGVSRDVVIAPEALPEGDGVRFIAMKMLFLQNVNGDLCMLFEAGYTALDILGVSSNNVQEQDDEAGSESEGDIRHMGAVSPSNRFVFAKLITGDDGEERYDFQVVEWVEPVIVPYPYRGWGRGIEKGPADGADGAD